MAGLAAGSKLTLPGSTGQYEIYFIFPLTQQVTTLAVLQAAVITTGSILVILLTFIAAMVARQVVTPVRAARRAAESLASGNLDDRMQVRGQDDIARMAASMNYMAAELQKQIKQLEDLSAVQQRFVSDVSHELRTPLTTVRMAAEVLHEARGDFDPVAARSAELLQNELDRFEALLTDLLEISRFDAGAAVLSLSEVDLVDVVNRVVEVHQPFADATGTQVRVHASGPCVAEVDARRIERILRNLLINAIEHGEGHPVDVYVEAGENAVAVAVRDHGVGFQADQARRVFHRFWRADPARARTVGGTGLGLAISMEDANLHNGWLTAWGRPGLGAQFRLTVPRRSGQILESSPLPMVPRDLVTAPLPSETAEGTASAGRSRRAPTARDDRRHRADRRRPGRPVRGPPLAARPGRGRPCCWSLAGCVAVPTSGPVERIEGGLPECTNCVNVDVAPPAFADTPQQIVEGYLRANSNFQPAYSVARQFLTEAAAGRWSPEAGARIYRGNTQADGDRVTLNGRLVGLLGSDRTYTPQDRALRVDFGLVKENGQWRISKPPNGLLVADFAFDSFYLPFNLYFVGNGRSLVPDPIYLPTVQNPAGLASVLMRALLGGPSDWLEAGRDHGDPGRHRPERRLRHGVRRGRRRTAQRRRVGA